jgi:hypothetical protein
MFDSIILFYSVNRLFGSMLTSYPAWDDYWEAGGISPGWYRGMSRSDIVNYAPQLPTAVPQGYYGADGLVPFVDGAARSQPFD